MSARPPAAGPAAAPSGPSRATAPAALSAFLRGVERRGAVLAELQAGDAGQGDAALAAAMAQFRRVASEAALSEWPSRFWSLLLTQPQLRQRTPVAIAMEATDRLGELGSGPRAALLLRLAAGLDETEAAAALGVAPGTYRLALQRALPRHGDGRADPQAWQQLREQVHRRIKTLPAARLERLAEARERALRETGPAGADVGAGRASSPARPRPRWLLPLLWSLLALCALAFAATFWWPAGFGGAWLGASDEIRISPLPEGAGPSERYSREAGLIAHRDFDLIADPGGEAAAAELEFHSWLAARDAGTVADAAAPAGDPGAEANAGAATAAPTPADPAQGSETDGQTDDL